MSVIDSPAGKRAPDIAARIGPASGPTLGLLALIGFHIVVCCISLIRVADYQAYMLYDPARLDNALVVVLAFSTVALLFVFARFSFGYLIGFYLFTMVLGFLWLNCFSKFNYDHRVAGLSAAASALLFLLPALLIDAPLRRIFTLSARNFDRVLMFFLLLALGTVVVASFYNFKVISIRQIYDFRNELNFPAPIRYLTGIASTALLPFVFACYLALNRRWWAIAPLVLMLLFYPITLSKFALFSTLWMIFLLMLSRVFEARTALIISILMPMLVGVVIIATIPDQYALQYFGVVNIRMMATPSSAIDIYNDFFSTHPHTWFCQISFVKPWMSCPYSEPLSIVMENAYRLGNLNASLFATEGIASVGLYFAPLTALACGLIVALGNRLSAGLPPKFVLISAALLPQTFLNVPFTTVLLTHGTAVLFLLWYVMPRTIFETSDRTGGLVAEPLSSTT